MNNTKRVFMGINKHYFFNLFITIPCLFFFLQNNKTIHKLKAYKRAFN